MFCDQMFIASVGSYIPRQAVSRYLSHLADFNALQRKTVIRGHHEPVPTDV